MAVEFVERRKTQREPDNSGRSDGEKWILKQDYDITPEAYAHIKPIITLSGVSGGGKDTIAQKLVDQLKNVHHLNARLYIPSQQIRDEEVEITGGTVLGPTAQSVARARKLDAEIVSEMKNAVKSGEFLVVVARYGGALAFNDPFLRDNSYRVGIGVSKKAQEKRVYGREKPKVDKINKPLHEYNVILLRELENFLATKVQMRAGMPLEDLLNELFDYEGDRPDIQTEERAKQIRNSKIAEAITLFEETRTSKEQVATTDPVQLVNVAELSRQRDEADAKLLGLAHPEFKGKDPFDPECGFYNTWLDTTDTPKGKGLEHLNMNMLIDGQLENIQNPKSRRVNFAPVQQAPIEGSEIPKEEPERLEGSTPEHAVLEFPAHRIAV